MQHQRLFLTFAVFVAGLAASARPARAEGVYYSTEGVLREFFPASERVTYTTLDTARHRTAWQEVLGYVPARTRYNVFVARTGDRVDGYAVVDEERGQHLPITFAVKLSSQGVVERAEVLAYREAYGEEIREARFLQQFVGVGEGDLKRPLRDVVAISGASISSRSMTIAIKRAVALVATVRASAPTAPLAGP
jgi:hypothetical protein